MCVPPQPPCGEPCCAPVNTFSPAPNAQELSRCSRRMVQRQPPPVHALGSDREVHRHDSRPQRRRVRRRELRDMERRQVRRPAGPLSVRSVPKPSPAPPSRVRPRLVLSQPLSPTYIAHCNRPPASTASRHASRSWTPELLPWQRRAIGRPSHLVSACGQMPSTATQVLWAVHHMASGCTP